MIIINDMVMKHDNEHKAPHEACPMNSFLKTWRFILQRTTQQGDMERFIFAINTVVVEGF